MEQTPAYLDLPPVRVWGQLTAQTGRGLLLQSTDEAAPYGRVILRGEHALCLDAVTGMPLDRKDLREGETLWAWIGPAVTLSLPPQAEALVILGNLPTDGNIPWYHVAARTEPCSGGVTVTTTDSRTLTVTGETELFPYLTRQIVRPEDLVPGSRMLVWTDDGGAVTRAMVFAPLWEE